MAGSTTKRLAIVGAHGTGKSTLLSRLHNQLPEVCRPARIVEEIARQICTELADPDYFKRSNNSAVKQLLLIIGQVIEESVGGSVDAG